MRKIYYITDTEIIKNLQKQNGWNKFISDSKVLFVDNIWENITDEELFELEEDCERYEIYFYDDNEFIKNQNINEDEFSEALTIAHESGESFRWKSCIGNKYIFDNNDFYVEDFFNDLTQEYYDKNMMPKFDEINIYDWIKSHEKEVVLYCLEQEIEELKNEIEAENK